MSNTKSMRELCINALQVQDACNLSGVVHSFSDDISRLRTLLEEELKGEFSTDKLNRHPVCVMWASKIGSLAGMSDYNIAFGDAYNWVRTHAEK